MAFSCHNSSTLVPPLGTPFNTISRFSNQMAYLPNTPQYSRWIHQRDCSSLKSPFSTIQPGQTVSLFLAQVSSLWTMILIGRMLPLILVLTMIQLINPHLLLTHGPNCYDWCLLETVWRKAKGITIWLAALQVVLVSILCSRCYNLILSLLFSHITCHMYYTLLYF